MGMSAEYPDLKFVTPKAFGTGRDGKAVRYLAVHYTAGAERSTSAEDGAAYDQRRTDGTSCHYFVDSDSVVQCVLTANRSNSAFGKGNRLGIHYEFCGTAQTRAQWLDAASRATIRNAARQMARDAAKYGIPIRRLTVAETRAAWYSFPSGPKGIVGHVDITNAYPEDGGTHTDPGSGFPWDVLLADINEFMGSTSTTSTPEGDDDMNAEESRMLRNIAEWVGAQLVARDTVTGIASGPGDQHTATFPNHVLNGVKAAAAAKPAVDAKAAAAAMTADVSFITQLAAAVAAQVTLQAGATVDQVRKVVDEELDEQAMGGADKD